jgi:hypothetical protein
MGTVANTLKHMTAKQWFLWGTIVALFVALLLFEYLNYVTTYESLAAVFGAGAWLGILAWAVVVTDLAALGRVFTAETDRKEPAIIYVLLAIWAVVTGLDAMLTWYFAALEMETNAVAAPSAIREFVVLFPIVVALMVWGVQAGLLYLFGKLLDGALHADGVARRRQPPQQSGFNQRPPAQQVPVNQQRQASFNPSKHHPTAP